MRELDPELSPTVITILDPVLSSPSERTVYSSSQTWKSSFQIRDLHAAKAKTDEKSAYYMSTYELCTQWMD